MGDFPGRVEDLSAVWLSEVLGWPVRDFRVRSLGEGVGVIGQVRRIELESKNGPSTIVAKFASPVTENRAVAETYNMYGREVQFYAEIASQVPVRSPQCYFGAFDEGSGDFILLLEDLQGYRVGDQVAGCTLAEARQILSALAGLHASTWQQECFDDIILHDNPMQRDGMIAGFQMGWPVVLEQFGDLVPEAARKVGDRYADNVPQLLEEMCREPVCLNHADVRLDNVFFDDEGIVLVDWQSICRSAPEQDVAYFITQSVPKAVRDREDLLAYYHDELTRRGVGYSLEECLRRYEVTALYLLSYAVVIAGTLDMGNARGVQLARTLLDGAMSELVALDAFRLIR